MCIYQVEIVQITLATSNSTVYVHQSSEYLNVLHSTPQLLLKLENNVEMFYIHIIYHVKYCLCQYDNSNVLLYVKIILNIIPFSQIRHVHFMLTIKHLLL